MFFHLASTLLKSKLFALITLSVCFTIQSAYAQYGYFYSGKDYGSEAIYTPFTQIISGGFDMVFVLNESSRLDEIDFKQGAIELYETLRYPKEGIDWIGWDTFLRSEILISTKNGQWVPNYTMHLLGGGMEYARLADFYKYHGAKFPRIYAAFTATTEHLLNEFVENIDREWLNYGTVSDIYLFNNAGMIAFSFEPIQRFFAEKLILRSWLSQTSYIFSDNSIQNVGQYYSIKWQPPFMKKYSLFTHYGAGFMIGAGIDKNENTISFGAGFRTKSVSVYNEETRQETISALPSAGVFVDKNNSLLASFIYNHGPDFYENVKIEIYPGFIPMQNKNLKLGFWVNLSFQQRSYAGITIGNIPSIGF